MKTYLFVIGSGMGLHQTSWRATTAVFKTSSSKQTNANLGCSVRQSTPANDKRKKVFRRWAPKKSGVSFQNTPETSNFPLSTSSSWQQKHSSSLGMAVHQLHAHQSLFPVRHGMSSSSILSGICASSSAGNTGSNWNGSTLLLSLSIADRAPHTLRHNLTNIPLPRDGLHWIREG